MASTAATFPAKVLTFYVCKNLDFEFPRAATPAGYVTFGFAKTLDEATEIALAGMLDHLETEYGLERVEAMALASLVVDMRVTQIVNDAVGVHAVLPQNAVQMG